MRPDATRSENALDKFALLAMQSYNIGNCDGWFGVFRDGYFGMQSRLFGLRYHSKLLHSWPNPLDMIGYYPFYFHEHNASVMLFCMDSAIECFVFALNALGQAVDNTGFHSVSDHRSLGKVSPKNVVHSEEKSRAPGYQKNFPSLQQHWANNLAFLNLIFDNHDVTKHRQQHNMGGRFSSDLPQSYLPLLGFPGGKEFAIGFAPAVEVYLPSNPKNKSNTITGLNIHNLEALETKFWEFINESIDLAVGDSRENISLNYETFQEQNSQR